MKNSKRTLIALMSMFLVIPLASCSKMLKVTFDFGFDGSDDPVVVEVEKGDTVDPLDRPGRVNYYFTGWYEGEEAETAFDFTTPITENVTLIAHWENFSGFSITVNGKVVGAELTVDADAEAPTKLVAQASNPNQSVEVTWASSDSEVLEVAADGTIDAKRRGQAIVTAQNKHDSTSKKTVKVNVQDAEWEQILEGADALYGALDALTEYDEDYNFTNINYTASHVYNNKTIAKAVVTKDGFYTNDPQCNNLIMSGIRLPDDSFYFAAHDTYKDAEGRDKLTTEENYKIYKGKYGGGTFYESLLNFNTAVTPEVQFDVHVGMHSGLYDLTNEFDMGEEIYGDPTATYGYDPTYNYYINKDGNLAYTWADKRFPGQVLAFDGLYAWVSNLAIGIFFYPYIVGFDIQFHDDGTLDRIGIQVGIDDDDYLIGLSEGVTITSDQVYDYGDIVFTDVGTTVLPQKLVELAATYDTPEKIAALPVRS